LVWPEHHHGHAARHHLSRRGLQLAPLTSVKTFCNADCPNNTIRDSDYSIRNERLSVARNTAIAGRILERPVSRDQ
jgi:hypothetical protein